MHFKRLMCNLKQVFDTIESSIYFFALSVLNRAFRHALTQQIVSLIMSHLSEGSGKCFRVCMRVVYTFFRSDPSNTEIEAACQNVCSLASWFLSKGGGASAYSLPS